MNADQQTRLEIMRALEKDFPDRLLEDLVHVARYVEHGGVEPEPPEQTETPSRQGEPRKWASLADIPDTVGSVEDRAGDVVERLTFEGSTLWLYTALDYADIQAMDADGPFIEVLS